MWSAAYGLIALAVVAFVALYAAAHAPSFLSVNLADQLYNAKKQLADDLSSFLRTTSSSDFAANVNVVRVKVANITVSGTTFPVQFPISYKLSARGDNLLYQVYLNVISCRPATLHGGAAVTLYVVELRHSLSQLPWLEVYAAMPRNLTQYYSWLYNLYTAWRKPPAVGLDPRLGADVNAGLVELVKAEWALVYDETSDLTILYAAAPPSAPYILVVDYPLAIPLACSPRS
ncbi:MAG: hypothetical protein ACO2PN_04450 [Pyrobaculum sp.]|jgi:hypothetical protein